MDSHAAPQISRLETWAKRLVVAAAALYLAATAVYMLKFARVNFCDFQARYNEVHCVWSGLDPYDLYAGKKTSPHFYAWWGVVPDDPMARCVDFYPPWAYTYLAPLAALPYRAALGIFLTLNLLAVLGIAAIGARLGYQVRQDRLDAAFAGACAIFLAKSLPLMLDAGNYGLLAVFAAIVMALFLNRNREVLAGLAWAFIMVKIQTGPLFFIPLVIARKYKTIAVAVAACVLASLPTALLVGKSPVDLVLCLASRGSDMIQCSVLGGALSRLFTNPQITLVEALLGVSVCAAASWQLRAQKEWLIKFVPPAITSTLWTYSQCQDQIQFAIPQLCLALLLLRERSAWRKAAYALGLLCLWYTCYESVLDFFDRFFAWPPQTKAAFQQARFLAGLIAALSWYGIALALPALIRKPDAPVARGT